MWHIIACAAADIRMPMVTAIAICATGGGVPSSERSPTGKKRTHLFTTPPHSGVCLVPMRGVPISHMVRNCPHRHRVAGGSNRYLGHRGRCLRRFPRCSTQPSTSGCFLDRGRVFNSTTFWETRKCCCVWSE